MKKETLRYNGYTLEYTRPSIGGCVSDMYCIETELGKCITEQEWDDFVEVLTSFGGEHFTE